MNVTDLFVETASSFKTNRVRSSIIVIGVIIGITTIISMSAVLGGIRLALIGDAEFSQERLVDITCSTDRTLTLADAEDMSKQLDDEFEVVMPFSLAIIDAATPTKKAAGFVQGVHANYASALGQELVQGRFITQEEYDSSDVVVVLDEASVKTLFGSASENVVGQKVDIKGTDYEIVGVLKSEGTTGNAESASLYMPFTTCARRVIGDTTAIQLLGIVREDVAPENAAYEAEKWLADRLKIPEDERQEALSIATMKSIVDRVNTMMSAMQLLVILVSSVSLLVGGIGIMEIMLTNVAERNREIGLRKALGASKRDITVQFLLESVCLTLGGGIIGILFGYFLSFGLASLAGTIMSLGEGLSVTPRLGIETILLVVGICVCIGVVFGFYPAYRAGKLDPEEPLRYQ